MDPVPSIKQFSRPLASETKVESETALRRRLTGNRKKPKALALTGWGRFNQSSWFLTVACACIVVLCPFYVFLTYFALQHYQGSILDTCTTLFALGPKDFFVRHLHVPNVPAFWGYALWLLFQATLYWCLPGPKSLGQITPAGNQLSYTTNGLLAWVITHLTATLVVATTTVDLTWLAMNWEGLLIAANAYGFALAAFAYFKAHVFPTHPEDRKFAGSRVYDFYMGIEFNPRFGDMWDFKLFQNGRPGIVAWTLIDQSFVALQYQLHGRVTSSILIANLFHLIYVIDLFVNEDWYVRTIDIAHDHFGFYLAWGSAVWLPAIYTLQAQYLARYPVDLSPFASLAILCFGICGYAIFRSANHEKNLARRTGGQCQIRGKQAQYITTSYKTSNGEHHESILLCSGWWGTARHVNYLGDLMLSYAACAACGTKHLLPWTYAIFMTILLVHRCYRDEERCSRKYGAQWKRYKMLVPWMIVPGVF